MVTVTDSSIVLTYVNFQCLGKTIVLDVWMGLDRLGMVGESCIRPGGSVSVHSEQALCAVRLTCRNQLRSIGADDRDVSGVVGGPSMIAG